MIFIEISYAYVKIYTEIQKKLANLPGVSRTPDLKITLRYSLQSRALASLATERNLMTTENTEYLSTLLCNEYMSR